MKVLIVNSLYKTPKWPKTIGGAETSVKFIAEGLAAEGHDVKVVAIADEHGSSDVVELVNNVEVHSVSSRNIYWIMSGKKRSSVERLIWHAVDDRHRAPALFENLLRDFRPDVLYTNTLMGHTVDVWRIAKKYGVKVVHTLRDYYLLCPKTTVFKAGDTCKTICTSCSLLTRHRREATKYVDAVVGNSKFILDYHLQYGLFRNASIKTSIGSISEIGAIAPRNREDGKVVFGYIGRFSRTKGIEQLIESFKKLPPDAELLLAGNTDNEYAESLAGMRDSRVHFIGFVKPIELYEKVDIVTVPSLWHEPLPRAAVDAVAANRPVVGSNRGGTVEAMGNPPFGWIYDPASPESFDQALYAAYAAVKGGSLPINSQSQHEGVLQRYQQVLDDIVVGRPTRNA